MLLWNSTSLYIGIKGTGRLVKKNNTLIWAPASLMDLSGPIFEDMLIMGSETSHFLFSLTLKFLLTSVEASHLILLVSGLQLMVASEVSLSTFRPFA